MSTSLPQELKTSKLNSLDSDLKKIAEELIADKFDVREEVVTSGDSSFRQDGRFDASVDPGFYDVLKSASVDNKWRGQINYTRHDSTRVFTRFDYSTHRRVSTVGIPQCSARGIHDAIRLLDVENLPRDNRIIRLDYPFWLELRRTEDFDRFLSWSDNGRGYRDGEYVGNMFGCKIFIAQGITSEIEVSY